MINGRRVLNRLGAVALCASLAAPSAWAQFFPTDRGPSNHLDPVTGYLCVDSACTVLRLPDADCICQKVNPGEEDLRRLQLTCTTREGGAWVACPVRPRYGTMIN